jgi:hypothetical protein
LPDPRAGRIVIERRCLTGRPSQNQPVLAVIGEGERIIKQGLFPGKVIGIGTSGELVVGGIDGSLSFGLYEYCGKAPSFRDTHMLPFPGRIVLKIPAPRCQPYRLCS